MYVCSYVCMYKYCKNIYQRIYCTIIINKYFKIPQSADENFQSSCVKHFSPAAARGNYFARKNKI